MANKQSKDKKDDKKDDKKKGLGRKEYEAEINRLQVQLCKLQDWVKYRGLRSHRCVRRTRRRRQGRYHSGTYGASESPCFPRRGLACSIRPGKDSNVHAALHSNLSRSR